MFNIFQGDERITTSVCRALGYEESDENTTHAWFTKDIYFQTFFYMTKRFGAPVVYDDYKDGGTWNFEVKEYKIQVYMNSSWVIFMMFGRKGHIAVYSPYVVKMNRERMRKRDQIVRLFKEEKTPKELEILRQQFDIFKEEKGFDEDKITDEEFNEKYRHSWVEWMEAYNDRVIGVSYDEVHAKYGDTYHNAYTRRALKTLEQFLKNMLTPIWVRDVPYNIKGKITDEEAAFYCRYKDNIKIKFQI